MIDDLLAAKRELPNREMLKRMQSRLIQGENESDLIIKALHALEHLEGRQMFDSLEFTTRNLRGLRHSLDQAIQQASEERDALRLDDLLELKTLINDPPYTGRTVAPETIDLALDYFKARARNPALTYLQHARNLIGKEAEGTWQLADKIKTAVKRFYDFLDKSPAEQELTIDKPTIQTKRPKKGAHKPNARRNAKSDT